MANSLLDLRDIRAIEKALRLRSLPSRIITSFMILILAELRLIASFLGVFEALQPSSQGRRCRTSEYQGSERRRVQRPPGHGRSTISNTSSSQLLRPRTPPQ